MLTMALDWDSLLDATAGSLVAGLGIVLSFSIGLRGLIRASELRADGHQLGAVVAAAIGALGLLVAIAGTMIGLLVVAVDAPAG